ncbi:MAG: hybrid sensor histidine kinase/response regulator [Candidatus Binatia bacterium]|nr:MAG: hybrid sensor histidine kinase/response regulator [Candidatus Binatia bacterium]
MHETEQPVERPTLLVVDDEVGPAEALRMVFHPHYRVLIARRGEEALDLLRHEAVDVVTLDLRMPHMTGVEVLRAIKSEFPDVEVIIITAYASLDTALQGLRWGAFDYIIKPFDVPHIAELVDRAVKRRRTRLHGRRTPERFLGNVSHELRTPLSAIIGYSSILAEELTGKIDAEQLTALQRIQVNAIELLDLIEGILILNAIDAGEIPVVVSEFDVVDVLRRVVEQFHLAGQDRGIDFAFETPAASLLIQSDAQKIERIVRALLDHVLKYSTDGGITVRLEGEPHSYGIRISVFDAGTAIDPEELQAAIQGFLADDFAGRRRDRGLGIGLRVAAQFTRMLGGRIHVEPQSPGGTKVTVEIPIWRLAPRVRVH